MNEWLLFNAKPVFCSVISWREQVNFQWEDDEVRFVLDQHAEFDLHSTSSLKQQSTSRYVAPLGHIILLPSQATNTNCIVFGLTRAGLEPTIYRTRGQHANHYTSDAVDKNINFQLIVNILVNKNSDFWYFIFRLDM